MTKDNLLDEYRNIRRDMQGISPKTSTYKDLELKALALKRRIDIYHELSPVTLVKRNAV